MVDAAIVLAPGTIPSLVPDRCNCSRDRVHRSARPGGARRRQGARASRARVSSKAIAPLSARRAGRRIAGVLPGKGASWHTVLLRRHPAGDPRFPRPRRRLGRLLRACPRSLL